MTTRFVRTAILLVVAGMFASTAFAQESYTLQYKYRAGKTYRYANLIATASTREMMGREVKTNADVTMTSRFLVEGAAQDGALTLVASVDSIRVSVKSPEMDTTIVPTELTGKRTRLVLTPLGVVKSRTVIDSVQAQAMSFGVGQRDVMKFHRLEAKPVKIGGRWSISSADSLDMMGGTSIITTDMAYTLAGKENAKGHDCLKISYTGTSTTVGKGSMMGMEIFIEGTSKLNGAFLFDPALGIIVSEETHANNESTVATTGQQAMTIPVSTTISSSQTLLED